MQKGFQRAGGRCELAAQMHPSTPDAARRGAFAGMSKIDIVRRTEQPLPRNKAHY